MDFETITEQGHILKDERPKNWFWDYNAVFDNNNLSSHAKLVRLYLARCTGANRSAWPSLNTIAKKCGISKPTVKKAISELIDNGWLVKAHRRTTAREFMSNIYTLTCPCEVADEPTGVVDGVAASIDVNSDVFLEGGFPHNPPVKNRTGVILPALSESAGGGQAQNPPGKNRTGEDAINVVGVGKHRTHLGSHVAPINTHISNIEIRQQQIGDHDSIKESDDNSLKNVVADAVVPNQVEHLFQEQVDTAVTSSGQFLDCDPYEPSQDEIVNLIEFARDQPREIILSVDYAKEIIRMAGSLDTAKEKIEAASAFIAKEYKAGRAINSIKGVMNRIMEMNTGGIKLGIGKLKDGTDERNKRLAEKEEKYKDLYIE